MKNLISLLVFSASAMAWCAPEVSILGVTVDQVRRTTTVRYSLSETAVVTFDVQTNGVSIGGAKLRGTVGDVNRKIAAGERTAVWCWPNGADGVALSADAAAVVTAWPLDHLPDFIVCDLCANKGFFFYADAESIPGGIGDRRYKTDYLVIRRIPAKGVVWKMGSSQSGIYAETQHLVTFTNDYYMAVYETTQRQFERIMGIQSEDSQHFILSATNAPALPMDGLKHWQNLRGALGFSWNPPDDAKRGGRADLPLGMLSSKTGFTFDLPTDAEWEYACRAGEGAERYDGTDDASTLENLAWGAANSGGKIHEVGLKAPNRWGLYDMYGNVGEWCLDHWTTNLCSLAGNIATNPPGPAFADKGAAGNTQYNRVLRGGNVSSAADVFRSAARRPQWITTTPFTGFRVVALNVKLEE